MRKTPIPLEVLEDRTLEAMRIDYFINRDIIGIAQRLHIKIRSVYLVLLGHERPDVGGPIFLWPPSEGRILNDWTQKDLAQFNISEESNTPKFILEVLLMTGEKDEDEEEEGESKDLP